MMNIGSGVWSIINQSASAAYSFYADQAIGRSFFTAWLSLWRGVLLRSCVGVSLYSGIACHYRQVLSRQQFFWLLTAQDMMSHY
jgi:hypothetical protein